MTEDLLIRYVVEISFPHYRTADSTEGQGLDFVSMSWVLWGLNLFLISIVLDVS